MKASRILLAIFAFSAVHAFAQAVPVNYDGHCWITSVTASQQMLEYSQPYETARMDFSCSGTFYGTVTANIHLEVQGATSTGTVSTGTYASISKTWPYQSQSCYYYFGSYFCFPGSYYPIPSSSSLTTSSTMATSQWRAVATVSWIVGPSTCYWYGCFPNQQSQTVTSAWQTGVYPAAY